MNEPKQLSLPFIHKCVSCGRDINEIDDLHVATPEGVFCMREKCLIKSKSMKFVERAGAGE